MVSKKITKKSVKKQKKPRISQVAETDEGPKRTGRKAVVPEIDADESVATSEGPVLTAFDIFEKCLDRANNLLRIHKEAHGGRARPAKHLSDTHRAAIVLAISALDAFVR